MFQQLMLKNAIDCWNNGSERVFCRIECGSAPRGGQHPRNSGSRLSKPRAPAAIPTGGQWSGPEPGKRLPPACRLRQDAGRRRQVSIGPRSGDTEAKKADFERKREEVHRSLAVIQEVILRQSAVNRVLGLGRVPNPEREDHARDRCFRLVDAGIRVLGTHALYAYEAAAGVHIEPGLTATGDVDLLFDARKRLAFIGANGRRRRRSSSFCKE